MGLQVIGNGGVILDVDGNRNIQTRRSPAHFGSLGGSFVVAGGTSAIVAAALAANTPLMAMRHGAAATSNVWLTRLRFTFNVATVGASGGVPGAIAWQKFSAATPTGGTARTPMRKDNSTGSATQVADVRDSNAALTVTGVTFGDIGPWHPLPNFTTGATVEYVADLDEDEFIRLAAGEGICLRTQVAAPATETWTYTYSVHYLEK